MKNFLLGTALLLSGIGFTQIETDKAWAGVGPGGGLNFYLSDSTDLVTIDCDYQNGHAIFMNPKDSLLYAILRPLAGASSDRNLYIINPFTGDIDLVYDLTTPFISSADIDATGDNIYLIQGNGGGGSDLGKIIRFNLTDNSETLITTISATPGSSSFGMEFHEPDSSLYIYEGHWDGDTQLQVYNLGTSTTEVTPLLGHTSQIHGAMHTGNTEEFLVFTSYDCNFYQTDGSPEVLTEYYNSCMPETHDITQFRTLYTDGDSVAICPDMGDITELSVIYPDINAIAWYKDGVLISGESGESLVIDEPGIYQSAMEIKETTAMLFSEEITVYYSDDCFASIEETSSFLSVYPNPFQNELTVKTSEEIQKIELLNMNGQIILSEIGIGRSVLLSTSELTKGNYLLRVVTPSGSSYEKVVK